MPPKSNPASKKSSAAQRALFQNWLQQPSKPSAADTQADAPSMEPKSPQADAPSMELKSPQVEVPRDERESKPGMVAVPGPLAKRPVSSPTKSEGKRAKSSGMKPPRAIQSFFAPRRVTASSSASALSEVPKIEDSDDEFPLDLDLDADDLDRLVAPSKSAGSSSRAYPTPSKPSCPDSEDEYPFDLDLAGFEKETEPSPVSVPQYKGKGKARAHEPVELKPAPGKGKGKVSSKDKGKAIAADNDSVVEVLESHPDLEDLDEDISYTSRSMLGHWMKNRDTFLKNIKRVVKPQLPERARHLSEYFDAPIIASRDISIRHSTTKSNRHGLCEDITFTDNQSGVTVEVRLFRHWLPLNNRKNAMLWAAAACDLLKRLPFDDYMRVLPSFKKNTVTIWYNVAGNIISQHAFPGKVTLAQMNIAKQTIGYRPKVGRNSFALGNVPSCPVDMDGPMILNVYIDDVVDTTNVPPISSHINLVLGKNVDENQSGHAQAIAILKHLYEQMLGWVGTHAALAKRRKLIIAPYMKALPEFHKHPEGPYAGTTILNLPFLTSDNVSRMLGNVYVKKLVKLDLQLSKKDDAAIRIRGGSRSKAILIYEIVHNVFLSGRGILNALQAGIVQAHLFNEGVDNGIRLGDICQCIDAERETTFHFCHGCFRYTRCSFLKRTDVEHLHCRLCYGKKNAGDDQDLPEVSRSLTNRLCYAWTSASVRTDRKELRVKPADVKRMLESIIIDDEAVIDGYLSNVLRYNQERDRGFSVPSIEAFYPFSEEQGVTTLHSLDNVIVTAYWLNLCKNFYLPGILGLISEAQQLRDQPINSEVCKDLVARFDHQCALTACSPKPKISRLNQPITTEQMAQCREIWKAGRSPSSVVYYDKSQVGQQQSYCSNTETRRLDQIITELEIYYGRSVPRSLCNAPWPFIVQHLPIQWSWRDVKALFAHRIRRMTIRCNRKHATVDTWDTLFLECIRQYLKNKGKDAFFGLEMTIWWKHPLCFAVGHDQHGQQMISGWTRNPHHFPADYDENKCNISFETQLSNYAKWNFASADYDRILEEARSLPQNCEFYTRLDPVSPITFKSSSNRLDKDNRESVFTEIFGKDLIVEDDIFDDDDILDDKDFEEDSDAE